MSALKLENTLNEIQENMQQMAPHRRPELFREFLVKGYTAVTLSAVPEHLSSELLRAKLCLGSLITLYDDFADRPCQANPQLLNVLYQLNFDKESQSLVCPMKDRQVIHFAKSLFAQITGVLEPLPHYHRLKEVLNFDWAQFYSANRYSSLVTAEPCLNSPLENRLYGHHNMGMVAVAMMDLMATEKLNFSELCVMRTVFLMGQRMGRIFNVLATQQREKADNDVTGELSMLSGGREVEEAKQRLHLELRELGNKILDLEDQIQSFSVKSYLEGLMKVQRLHERMEGTI